MRALLLFLFLGGCTVYGDEIEAVGGRAFDELEAGSALGVKASKRYLCRTARVGPLLDELDTPEESEAWAALCLSAPSLPAFDQSR